MNVTLKQNDRLDFENPIAITYETAQRIETELISSGAEVIVNNLYIEYTQNNIQKSAMISSAFNSGEYSGIEFVDIGIDDTSNKLFTLNFDNMFKNLAVSITYKGEEKITINRIFSQTSLKYASMKLLNWKEIKKYKNIISKTGQIEKTVDVKSGWFTINELIDYIRNLFVNNEKNTNQINIICDESNNLEIGDRIEIDLDDYFVKGNFIITAINETIEGNETKYDIELRNTNLQENYIDLFRSSADLEEEETQVEMEYIVEYAEEDKIVEIHEVNINSEYDNTLNSELRG